MDFVASGTIHTRTKTCGRANCRCAKDPDARHGPYYEWSRQQNRRLVHSVLSKEEAEVMAYAISNYRQIQRLMEEWERETAEEIIGPKRANR